MKSKTAHIYMLVLLVVFAAVLAQLVINRFVYGKDHSSVIWIILPLVVRVLIQVTLRKPDSEAHLKNIDYAIISFYVIVLILLSIPHRQVPNPNGWPD